MLDMSTEKTFQISSTSLDHTFQIGEKIGANLRGGDCIVLQGDVGAGKTSLTHGIAKGAKSVDEVASPSFTISRQYECEAFSIHHFDFYRLDDAGVVASELEESVDDEGVVVIIEWSDIVSDVLPDNCIEIKIDLADKEDERSIKISGKDILIDRVCEGLV